MKREHFEAAKKRKCYLGLSVTDSNLKPSDVYLEMKKREFFERGGSITVLKPGPDCRLMGEVNFHGSNNSAAQTTFYREHC